MDSLPGSIGPVSSVKLAFIAAIRTSLDVPPGRSVGSAAIEDYTAGRGLFSSNTLSSTHIAGWADIWSSGVEVKGRPDVSVAVNTSLFAILSSVRDDWPYGLAPGGLSNSYNGHSFWDTEIWMYPSLLYLHPLISKSLLAYRFDRMDGARSKAASYNPPYAGTMYPWESAFSGIETCPTFAATGDGMLHACLFLLINMHCNRFIGLR